MSTQHGFKILGGALLVLTATGIAGCDESTSDDINIHSLNDGEIVDDDDVDFTPVDEEVSFRMQAENGRELNGSVLNSRNFNSRNFNSRNFNGTALASIVERINGAMTTLVHINGTPLTNIQIINGSLLSAYDGSGTRIGAQLNNTVYKINFDPMANGGEDLTFKILSVVQHPTRANLYFHTVHQINELDEFETLCRDGAGNPTEAIALPGTWDGETAIRQASTGKFTWACRGASLAKAVEWGYEPWVDADAHQAAMRMIRADYCGDGVTHTSNGNPIDVSDKWGIQTPDTTWGVEAKWGPNGAVCLNTPRKLSWPRETISCAASLPYCTSDGTINGTPNTNPSQYGGLLMTQVVPNNNPSAY